MMDFRKPAGSTAVIEDASVVCTRATRAETAQGGVLHRKRPKCGGVSVSRLLDVRTGSAKLFPAGISDQPHPALSRQAVEFLPVLLRQLSAKAPAQPVAVVTRKVELYLFQHLAGGFQEPGGIAGIRLVAPHVSLHLLGGQQPWLDAQGIEPARPMVNGFAAR